MKCLSNCPNSNCPNSKKPSLPRKIPGCTLAQGSIRGPILSNIFINDALVFIKERDICNFADDTTLYGPGTNLD